MVGAGLYRSLLVLSLDEEEVLWQMLDEALELSLADPQRSYELSLLIWEESRGRSAELTSAVIGLLSVLWADLGDRD